MHSDHLNTPRMLSDENGTVVWTWFADAFGTEFKGGYGLDAPDPDPDGNGQKVWYQLRFPGQYKSYNYFRDINRSTGRYLQSDPIGLDGGLNTYLYANANPVRFMDPEGLATVVFGGSWSFQFGGTGASGSIGIGQEFGTENQGRICMEVETCGRIGPGASAGVTFYGEVGEGSFCPGNQVSGGVFAEEGPGFFEGIELKHGTTGNSAGASARMGAGAGGSIGSEVCLKRVFCFP